MTAGAEQRAKALFVEALELDPGDRSTFLATRCGDDADLRRRVEELLAAYDRADAFLVDPPAAVAPTASFDEPLGRDALLRALDVVAPASALEAGEELSAYRIVSRLGAGGMGTVYLAELVRPAAERQAGERVALKVVHQHLLETDGFFKRFLREARVGREVQHENVVRTLDCDAVARAGRHHHFLVMEWVEGQTLRDLLREIDRVPEELCRHIGREVARGLAAIHAAGAVHRDIKPDNVLITPNHVVKVMDLGVARLQDEVMRLSHAGSFLGSIEYAAPEQLDDTRTEVDGRADLYALGVVLYELATGQHPHRSDDARRVLHRILESEPRRMGDVNPQLSPYFEEVVHTLLAKDPEERFASAAEVADLLAQGEAAPWWDARARGIRVATKQPVRRIRIPRETVLCGRDDELRHLDGAFERARRGDGGVVLIEGEAGIGKTRLVDEFVARLRARNEDFAFLFGSYPPGSAATSPGALSEAFAAHFGPAGSTAFLSQVPLLAPAFDAVLRGEPAPPDATPLSRDALGTCFVHATRNLATECTTVVLIDDLHFASADSRSLFAQLASSVSGHRILLLGTMRPGVSARWIADLARLDHATTLHVARLGPKDLTELLVDAFQSERLAEELGFRIAHKSDGNPFFAFEIIRGLREGQFIQQRPDGTWFRTSMIQEIRVPSSVTDLVEARLEDLSDAERELLDVAACVGFAFDPELVARVAAMDVVPALRAFGRIESRHRLVRSAGADLVFDHHQVQESLYDGLLPRLRTRYHGVIAETMVSAATEAPTGARCVELCTHFLAGDRGDRAIGYLDAALDHLQGSFQHEQAAALATRALADPGLLQGDARLALLLRRNRSLDLLGRRPEQEAALTEALSLAEAEDDGSLLRVVAALGQLCAQTGRHEAAERHHARSLALAQAAGNRVAEIEATGDLGYTMFRLGRYDDARTRFDLCLAMAAELGDDAARALAERDLAAVCTRTGRYAEAHERLARALDLIRKRADRHAEGQTHIQLCVVLLSAGRFQEALPHAERAVEITREVGYRRGEAVAIGNVGNALHGLGRHAEAGEHLERWLQLSQEIGDRGNETSAVGTLGQFLLAQGRLADAHRHLQRMLDLARETGMRPMEGRAKGSLGDVHHRRGHAEAAADCFREQLAVARETGDRRQEAYALSRLGDLAIDAGNLETARAHLESAVAIRRALGEVHVTAPLTGLARVAFLAGDRTRAMAALDEALDVARRHENGGAILLATTIRAQVQADRLPEALDALGAYEQRADHWTRLETRARLWETSADPVHLDEAHRLLEHTLAHAATEDRRRVLEGVPLHADLEAAWRRRAVLP